MECSSWNCPNKTTKGKVILHGLCDCKEKTLFKNQFCKKHTDNPSTITNLSRLNGTLVNCAEVEV